MDSATLVDGVGLIVLPLIGAVFLFFQGKFKDAADKNSKLESNLNDLKLHIAENYVKKEDFKEILQEIKDNIGKLFNKIDRLIEVKEDKRG